MLQRLIRRMTLYAISCQVHLNLEAPSWEASGGPEYCTVDVQISTDLTCPMIM